MMSRYRKDLEDKRDKKKLAKANVAVGIDVSADTTLVCLSSTHQQFPSRTSNIGLIDTGCNVLCLSRASDFDSLVRSTSTKHISVADGKSVPIEGRFLL